MSRLKRILTNLEKENICTDYLNGSSINKLQKQTKLQWQQIKQILLNNNIKVMNAYEIKMSSCSLPEKEYFDNLNSLECYVLGLIFGDGCVHYNEQKYKYALNITSNDLDILESARTLFGTQFKITKRKTSNAYNFTINSKFLCKELINKFNLKSPKSDNLFWPQLPNDMYSYFISGLLSTDGCVRTDSRRKNKMSSIEFSYSSNSLEFIKNLQNYFIKTLNISETKIKVNNTKRNSINYSLRYTGLQANQILQWIYANTTNLTRCQRKYNLYQNYLTSVSNSTI